jgi:uncharacterized OB-fold protein
MSEARTETMGAMQSGRENVLAACKCGQCGRVFFPRRTVCTECGSTEPMLDFDLKGPGTLYSYSIIHAAPKAFSPPYAVGYVDFPEDVRVLGQIVGWGAAALAQGATMTIERAPIAREPDGSLRESFVFRVADRHN